MQAIWKGTISFGMVTIPVKVYSATEQRDVSFRQVHAADGGRIRYKRVCEIDKEEVPYSDIAKGYEMPDGRMVVLSAEDFEALPLPTAKSIEVMEFVPIDQVDPIYFAKAYYLAADNVGAKPYVLLRDALTSSGQCAVVKVAIRTRESLALLREKDGALVLQTMLWPDEVRESEFAVPDDSVEVREQERSMAESYIATLQTEFEPTKYHSAYREALEELIEAKTSGLEPAEETAEEEAGDAEVVDLVAALRASVAAAKERRGEAVAGDDGTEEATEAVSEAGGDGAGGSTASRGPVKKSTAKKGAATKSTAKKSASKKSTAKKSSSDSGSGGSSRSASKKSTSRKKSA